uniref:Uncharacterized protein n=1 Tax=Pseudothermotoga hypogea TaxID=57487 RepID=A0A832I915_9THEM
MDTRIVLEDIDVKIEYPVTTAKEVTHDFLLSSYSETDLYVETDGFKSTIDWIYKKYPETAKRGKVHVLGKMINAQPELSARPELLALVLTSAVGQFLQKHPDCVIESFAIGRCHEISKRIHGFVLLFANSPTGRIGAVYIAFHVRNSKTLSRFTGVVPYDEGVAVFEDGEYMLIGKKGSYSVKDSEPWIIQFNELITVNDIQEPTPV